MSVYMAVLLTVMFVANRRWLSTRGTEATLPTIDSGPTMVLECASCRPLCLLPGKARPRSIEGGRDGGDGGACGIGGKGVEVTLSAATTSRKAPNFIEEGATQSMMRSEEVRVAFSLRLRTHTSNQDKSSQVKSSQVMSSQLEPLDADLPPKKLLSAALQCKYEVSRKAYSFQRAVVLGVVLSHDVPVC